MLSYAITIAFGLLVLSITMIACRLFIGPTTLDRLAALDALYLNSIALIILLGIHDGLKYYFEAALLIAMMGFVGTVAVTRFLLRGKIIE